MNTLYNYFNNEDSQVALSFLLQPTSSITITHTTGEDEIYEFPVKARYKVAHRIIQLSIYLKKVVEVAKIIECILENIENVKELALENKITTPDRVQSTIGDNAWSVVNIFYFYTEDVLSADELNFLKDYCKGKPFTIQIKTIEYAEFMESQKKIYAFISHDSRDKKLIAQPLAQALNGRLCPVWYDEYSLKIGANLRESIEKGIKEADKCILILTKHFLKNPGWTKQEFETIFAREMVQKEKVTIPIWYGVKSKHVHEYCPALSQTVALIWPSSKGKVPEDYNKEVTTAIDKIYNLLKAPQKTLNQIEKSVK